MTGNENDNDAARGDISADAVIIETWSYMPVPQKHSDMVVSEAAIPFPAVHEIVGHYDSTGLVTRLDIQLAPFRVALSIRRRVGGRKS